MPILKPTELKVIRADRNDVYRDMARAHHADRGKISEGQICRITVNGISKLLAVRGVPDNLKGSIRLDDATRFSLGLTVGTSYKFEFSSVQPHHAVFWACNASDPASRISVWIAVWSLILAVLFGLCGLFLGLWPLISK